MVNLCGSLVKCILFIFCSVSFACGLAVLASGIWLLQDRETVMKLTNMDYSRAAAYIVVISGAVILFVSFVGMYGTMKESRFILAVYFLVHLMIIMLLVVAGALALSYKEKVFEVMQNKIVEKVREYAKNEDATKFWDLVHKKFMCCGVTVNATEGYTIWQANEELPKLGKKVPDSCCSDQSDEGIKACQKDPKNLVFQDECYGRVMQIIISSRRVLAYIGFGVVIVLVTAATLSGLLCFCIKKDRRGERLTG